MKRVSSFTIKTLLQLISLISLTTCSFTKEQFAQRKDHFDPGNNSTFQQYYWIDESFYIDGGPALVYLTSFPDPAGDFSYSTIASWANSTKGLMIELGVRYSSGGDPSLTFTAADFKYQTVEQNLADIITFRVNFIDQFPQYINVPWIVIGEYYTANYATWAREKYPNVITGAVAVGAPVYSVPDFPEYFEFFSNVAGAICAQAIHNATVALEELFENHPEQADAVKAMFGCTDVPDNTQFFYVVSQLLVFGLSNSRSMVCGNMTSEPNGGVSDTYLVDTYASVINSLLVSRFKSSSYTPILSCIENLPLLLCSGLPDCSAWNIADDTNSTNTFRPTLYLSCNAFGQFQTAGTPGPTTIVSSNLTVAWYEATCLEVFDVVVTPQTNVMNIAYGGYVPWGSNYAFVSTLSDPYRSLQVNQTSLPLSKTIFAPTIESIFDFLSGENYGAAVQAARDEVLTLINSWISISTSTPIPSPTFSTSYSEPQSEQDGDFIILLFIVLGIICFIFILGLAVAFILTAIQRRQENLESVGARS